MRQNRLNAKTVAKIGPQRFFEIFRRDEALVLQARGEIGDIAAFFQEGQHPVAQLWPFHIPIQPAGVVGHRDQRVGGVMAGRRQTWISQGRNVEILREVRAHHLLLEDLVEQGFIARAQDDVVVAQIGIILALLVTEIDHHQ